MVPKPTAAKLLARYEDKIVFPNFWMSRFRDLFKKLVNVWWRHWYSKAFQDVYLFNLMCKFWCSNKHSYF